MDADPFRRLMTRRARIVAALPLLLIVFVGMIAIIAMICDPLPPEDHLRAKVRRRDEVEDGIYPLGLVANDTAVDSASEDPQLELALITAPPAPALSHTDDGVTVTGTPRPDWPFSRDTTPVAGCDGSGLQTFEVVVERAAEDHDVELEFAARIRYQAGRDSVPDGAALALWIEQPSGSATGTVGSDPVTLLTAKDRSRQIRTAVIEMSRDHVSEGEIAPAGTLPAVWSSGVVLGVIPVDVQARITLEASNIVGEWRACVVPRHRQSRCLTRRPRSRVFLSNLPVRADTKSVSRPEFYARLHCSHGEPKTRRLRGRRPVCTRPSPPLPGQSSRLDSGRRLLLACRPSNNLGVCGGESRASSCRGSRWCPSPFRDISGDGTGVGRSRGCGN